MSLASLHAGNGPQWWVARGVVNPAQPAEDYAAANLGQLKHMATQAAAELNDKLSGGAGPAISALVASWQQSPAGGVVRNDYAALTIGQLKAVAEPFYVRLGEAGIIPVGKRPWTITGADETHAAVANLGQLKTVFSFIATIPASGEDSDGDGMADAWELLHYGNLSRAGNEALSLSPGGLRVRDAHAFNLNPNTLDDGTAGSATGITQPKPPDVFTYDSRGWLASAKLDSADTKAITTNAEGNITRIQ
ncbi:MAG: hypothetical protein LBK99_17435 [Opitutaceae bacterium]|nr:hypothetical protein [Opitutaceae bacterium]